MKCDQLKKMQTTVGGVHATVATLCDTEMSLLMKVMEKAIFYCSVCGTMKAFKDEQAERNEYGIEQGAQKNAPD